MKQASNVKSHFGWNESEQSILWDEVRQSNAQGRPLRAAFENTAKRTGRKANSIRNYYYASIKEQGVPGEFALRRAVPFTPFTQQEADDLIRRVLQAQGSGRSVRACVIEMAGGDKSQALRLQNKYRSLIKSHSGQVLAIARELKEAGLPSIDPYQKQGGYGAGRRSGRSSASLRDVCAQLRRLDGDSAKRLLLAVADALEA